MRNAIEFAVIFILTACAAQALRLDKQAIDDFVAVRQLESVNSMRADSSDRWDELNDSYLLYRTRHGEFLVRFARPCGKLADKVVTADKRWESTRIRARFDTIRGCRIGEIFALREEDTLELNNLGESPGSRN
jgi:hypothetical protein